MTDVGFFCRQKEESVRQLPLYTLKRRTNPILEEDDDTLILIVDCQPNSHRFLKTSKAV